MTVETVAGTEISISAAIPATFTAAGYTALTFSAIDDEDAGQDLLKLALDSDADYSFKVEYQGGAIDYFQAKVMSFQKASSSVDSMRTASVQLSLTTSKTGVGIIEVDAP